MKSKTPIIVLLFLGLWFCLGMGFSQQQNFPGGLPSGFTTAAGQILAPNSSCGTAPPYSWAGITTTGFIAASGIVVVCVSGSAPFAWTPTGISNSAGLQVFNTSTTCTTAATINTPCTTASITLPTGYADTNYRLSCTGLGVTQFPQIQTVTKSNTTFTITLNNLTAAAASYTSFDCMASHN